MNICQQNLAILPYLFQTYVFVKPSFQCHNRNKNIKLMDIVFWLWLLNAPQLGARTFYTALKVFETPEAVFGTDILTLKQNGLFHKKTLLYLGQKDLGVIKKDLDWTKVNHCHIINLIDPCCPQSLAPISDPPPLLYVMVDIGVLNKPQLGMVGSRNPTQGGRIISKELAQGLSRSGLVVTSGMATGIDGEAHIGARYARHTE